MASDMRFDRLLITVAALSPVPLLAWSAGYAPPPGYSGPPGWYPVSFKPAKRSHYPRDYQRDPPSAFDAAPQPEARRSTQTDTEQRLASRRAVSPGGTGSAGARPAKQAPAGQMAPPKRAGASTGGDHRKEFLERLAPLVKAENARILDDRARMQELFELIENGKKPNGADAEWLKTLAQRYRVKKDPTKHAGARKQLLIKVDSIPMELALAQAATESGWGRSRFAKEGLNLFGVWTYDKSKGLVPKGRDEDATFLVRKYESHTESVRHYLNLLNSHPAYMPLRKIRLTYRSSGERPSGVALAEGLLSYSAKGQDYIELIQKLIADHELDQFRNV